MLKALKVTLIIYAVIGIIFGIGFIVIPDDLSDWFNFTSAPDYVKYFLAVLGSIFLIMGVFFIIVSRDLIRNIHWVKFAMAEGLTGAVIALYALIRDYGNFQQMGPGIIIHGVFAVLLLIFYPWPSRLKNR